MRLAWFRPTQPDLDDPLDAGGALVEALRSSHEIDVVTASEAHAFVWMQFRRPYDLCIFELDNTPGHQFIWPYLLHYGGVTMLRTVTLNEGRASALTAQRRGSDYRAEVEFSRDWRLLRAPLLTSRLAVVAHDATAQTLQDEYPEARVRHAPIGVRRCERAQVRGWVGSAFALRASADEPTLRVGVLGGTNRANVIRSAHQRARDAGADVTLMTDEPATVLRDADIVIAVRWPVSGEPETAALAGMAAARPVVVMETEVTADWPAYDPQTWRPRGTSSAAPVVVSIDPRDEEHSLMMAIRDLARDHALREQLGAAALEWWRTHATVEHAADAWQRILAEARTLAPPPRPADWPPHLSADGTEEARAILRDTGASVDFLSATHGRSHS